MEGGESRVSYIPDIHRMLPQSPDAEKAVLSAFFLDPEYAGAIYDEKGLTQNYFHIPSHRTIFSVMKGLYEDRKPVNYVSVTQLLRDRGELDSVGGAAEISGLTHYFPTAINAGYDADIVIDKHTLREVIRIGTEFASAGYEPQESPQSLVDGLECAVNGIRKGDDTELKEIDPKEGAMAAIRDLERVYEQRGKITGLSTGLFELDRLIDGLHPGEVFVIAGRPSMGKTALAMNIAEHIAFQERKPIAVFSAEMAGKELHKRLLHSVARVNFQRVRDGFMSERDFPAITAAACKIASSKLLIVEAIGATINAVRSKARRMHRKHKLGAIMVDYLQLLRSKSAQAQRNREREISEISQGLKNLAKELDIPIIVLAQLNRSADKRTGEEKGRPMLSDLRESGSIEQDADTVGLLMREEMYATNDEQRRECEGKALLIIAKQRNGPIGDIPLTFLKEFTRFENRAREASAEPRDYHD